MIGCWLTTSLSCLGSTTMRLVDGFESYTSTEALETNWNTVAGTPVVSLESNTVCDGQRAMALSYSGNTAPFTNLVRLTFAANQNWSTNTTLAFSYGGFANSNDAVIVRLLDQSGNVLVSRQIEGGTLNPPCSSAVFYLVGVAGLQAVRSVELGIVAGSANHSGTIYFDDLKIGDLGLLSVLGSSLGKGYNSSGYTANQLTNGSYLHSYAADLTTNQPAFGWRVVNQSIGGDTTPKVISR
ncbi:MAG TPA: hypothetical protein VGO57_18775, partial [Verrucomicrobiae bacterium]